MDEVFGHLEAVIMKYEQGASGPLVPEIQKNSVIIYKFILNL